MLNSRTKPILKIKKVIKISLTKCTTRTGFSHVRLSYRLFNNHSFTHYRRRHDHLHAFNCRNGVWSLKTVIKYFFNRCIWTYMYSTVLFFMHATFCFISNVMQCNCNANTTAAYSIQHLYCCIVNRHILCKCYPMKIPDRLLWLADIIIKIQENVKWTSRLCKTDEVS